ncbi:hypothetical protein RHCRD62_100046 [Rhodococcus sp. RD6.2]|nr:hypothetical protein RHCRD62_100046 [Rhodococcus sp. RD6.2]
MPSATSYRPCMAHSCDWRHRLGWTVSGHSSERNAKASLFQTVSPASLRTMPGSSLAIRPRCASSKSWVSENGKARLDSACCASMLATAGFWSVIVLLVQLVRADLATPLSNVTMAIPTTK